MLAINITKKIGSTKYKNFTFPSVVSLNNVCGIQFHAEKSSKNGLSLLKILLILKKNE